MRALLIDHDDSFTENLRHWLKPIFETIDLISCHDLEASPANTDVFSSHYDLIVLSPGPNGPNDYSLTLRYLKSLPKTQAVLGVCLGLQIMVLLEGGVVQVYSPPRHGKQSNLQIVSPQYSQFQNYRVARYHSLKCLPNADFETIAVASDDKIPMWFVHKNKKWIGFQFHPESFLTENSDQVLNWLDCWIRRCSP